MEIKSKPRYFIDDEMILTYAKDAMEADLGRREKAYEEAQEFTNWLLQNTPDGYKTHARRAAMFYLSELESQLEWRKQTYEKFLQIYKELEDARYE